MAVICLKVSTIKKAQSAKGKCHKKRKIPALERGIVEAFEAIDNINPVKAKIDYIHRTRSPLNAAIRRYLWTGDKDALEET